MKKVVCISVLFVVAAGWMGFHKSIPGDQRQLILKIRPVFEKNNLIPQQKKYVSVAGDTLYIDLVRFYISAVKVSFDNGTVYSEKESYHLIDIRDSVCPEISLKNFPAGKIKSVEFNLGIDSLTSVSGAMGGDLDPVNGMYWSWNSGYINAKLEGRSSSCKTLHNAFEFHIGGYLPKENALRKISLTLKNPVETGMLILNSNAAAWFTNIKLSETNSIVIPGKEAMKMADNYSKMFSIEEN